MTKYTLVDTVFGGILLVLIFSLVVFSVQECQDQWEQIGACREQGGTYVETKSHDIICIPKAPNDLLGAP